MIVAIDSSVLIAAQISRAGTCADLLEDVLLHHKLVLSEFILGEVERKLRVKFGYPATDAKHAVAYLRRVSTLVVPADLPGECSVLVSVDRDLLDLVKLRGIPIIRPGQFWSLASVGD